MDRRSQLNAELISAGAYSLFLKYEATRSIFSTAGWHTPSHFQVFLLASPDTPRTGEEDTLRIKTVLAENNSEKLNERVG